MLDVKSGGIRFNGDLLNAGVFQIAPNLHIFLGSTFTSLGGTVTGGGTLALVGTPIISGDISALFGDSLNFTNVTVTGNSVLTGTMNLYGNSTISGQLTVSAGGQLYLSDGTINGSGIITNTGLIRKSSGTGTCSFGPGLVNFGRVETASGTLNLLGGMLLDGQFIAATNSVIQFGGGSFTYDGQPQFTGTGLFQLMGGTFQLRDVIPNLQLLGGTITLSSDFQTNGMIDHLDLGGCGLAGTNTVTGVLALRSGTVSGRLTVAGSAQLNLGDGSILGSGVILNSLPNFENSLCR